MMRETLLRWLCCRFHQADDATSGIEYIVPILGGLGRDGVMAELPAILQVRILVLASSGALGFRFAAREVSGEGRRGTNAVCSSGKMVALVAETEHHPLHPPVELVKRASHVMPSCRHAAGG